MPKKTLGFVRLVWRCPNCSQMNPGTQKTCTSCGSPQPEGVQFEEMPQQDLSTDPALAEKAGKGADIHCPYCQTRNPADAVLCVQCGGDLKGGQQRQSGKVLGAFKPGQPGEIACPTCGTFNSSSNTRCSSCGASLAPSPLQPPPVQPVPIRSAPPATAGKKRSPLMWVGLVGLLCILGLACFALISFLTRTSEVSGTVTSLDWTLSIDVEQLVPVTHSDWVENIPADGKIGTCHQKVNRVQDYPEGNSQEVCGTPYTVDTGTGVGEVVQDCHYEIYMDYCEYAVQEWKAVDRVIQTGQDAYPFWPDPVLSADQRQGTRTEDYTVHFDTEKGLLDYSTHDQVEFQKFFPGSIWMLDVNTFGSITGYRPK